MIGQYVPIACMLFECTGPLERELVILKVKKGGV